jgi:hypothetical protein
MNHIQKMLSLFTVTLLLAACGGGGSGSSTTPQGPLTISGQVQQGNIQGAQVFLDLNGNGVKEAGEPAAAALTGTDGKFALSLTADQVTTLKAASATAKIVSAGGTDTSTTLEVGLLASDLPALTGASATKNVTAMTTLTAMTPDAKKGDLKTVLGTLGLNDSGSANDDKLIENATPAVIALCKSVESALLNVKKSTSVAAAQAVAAEMGKALAAKTKAELTDTQKLADTLAAAAGTALSAKKTELGLTDAQVAAMVTAIGKGCKGVADAVMSQTSKPGETLLSTEDHTKTESEIMKTAGTAIHNIVETANTEFETAHSGGTIPPVVTTTPDTTAPAVTAFTLPASATSLSVSVSAFTATDNVAVTGFMITQSATPPPVATDVGWTATAPAAVTAAAAGGQTFFPWAKDAAGNVSAVGTPATVNITLVVAPRSVAVSASGTDTTSAVGADATFTFAAVANVPYTFTISGFGAGDKLVFPVFGGAPNALNITNASPTDGSVTIQLIRNVGGDKFDITVVLNGLTAAQDQLILKNDVASFNAVFGANSIQ